VPAKLITLSDYPPNLCVLTAPDFHTACALADQGMRMKKIQGAVWVRRDKPAPLPAKKLQLMNQFRQHCAYPEYSADLYTNMNGANFRVDCDAGGLLSVHNHPEIQAADVLDDLRTLELRVLSNFFARGTLSNRYHCKTQTPYPHYDKWTPFARPEDQDMPFLGHDVRIVATRSGPGPVVYYTGERVLPFHKGGMIYADSDLGEQWQVATGDYIFCCSLEWGTQKALAHDSPEFSCVNEEDCREVDVYDGKGPALSWAA
jgi:hypothetical protein